MLDNQLGETAYDSLQVLEKIKVTGAGGRASEVLVTQLSGLSIQDHELTEMRTLVGSLANIGKAYGTSIDGILGYPFFAQGRTLIDFKRRKISMYSWEAAP